MRSASLTRSSETGFTLLEVLIALAIVAIALSALIKATGDAAGNAAYMRERVFAQWVGENQLAELQARREWPDRGTRRGTEELGERSWSWVRVVSDTPQAGVRRIDIEIAPADDEKRVLARITGFAHQPLQGSP
jgi:general secretion pathway protein I